MVLSAKAIANPTVQRFRLRSTSEPPPNGPAPVPTPKAPDSPASLPECIRIRKIRTTQMNTCRMPRSVVIGPDGSGHSSLAGAIERVQDLHRLRAQRPVDPLA